MHNVKILFIFINFLIISVGCSGEVLIQKRVTIGDANYYTLTLQPTESRNSLTGVVIPQDKEQAFKELEIMLPKTLKVALKQSAESIAIGNVNENECFYACRYMFLKNFQLKENLENETMFYSDFIQTLTDIWPIEAGSKIFEHYNSFNIQGGENIIMMIVEECAASLIDAENLLAKKISDLKEKRARGLKDPCELNVR